MENKEEGAIVEFNYDGVSATGRIKRYVGEYYWIDYDNREVKVHKDRVKFLR